MRMMAFQGRTPKAPTEGHSGRAQRGEEGRGGRRKRKCGIKIEFVGNRESRASHHPQFTQSYGLDGCGHGGAAFGKSAQVNQSEQHHIHNIVLVSQLATSDYLTSIPKVKPETPAAAAWTISY